MMARKPQTETADGAFAELEARVVACERCPELRAYCRRIADEKKRAYRDRPYWGKPVPAFGDARARVLLVGLAPGAHGSNRTGRMFTGDGSGVWLYRALHRAGFASQAEQRDRSDGMQLRDVLISAAVRCAPPGNAPTPDQKRRCLPYLIEEVRMLDRLRVVVDDGMGCGRLASPYCTQKRRLGIAVRHCHSSACEGLVADEQLTVPPVQP